MRNKKWLRLLAYVTGSVNQKLLLQNEYLAAENRILRAKRIDRSGVRASPDSGTSRRTKRIARLWRKR